MAVRLADAKATLRKIMARKNRRGRGGKPLTYEERRKRHLAKYGTLENFPEKQRFSDRAIRNARLNAYRRRRDFGGRWK